MASNANTAYHGKGNTGTFKVEAPYSPKKQTSIQTQKGGDLRAKPSQTQS